MADKKISQLPNLDRVNYTTSDLLLINNGLAPYSAQTTSNTLVFDFFKYYTGVTNYITGVTFNLGVLTMYLNGTVQTIPVTGLTNTYLTGGTYSKSLSAMTFTNNTGGTFSVTGMYFPKKPAGTLNSIQYNNNQKFSGNTLIYNSGTTSIYNRGYNNITGNTFYGEDAGGRVTDSATTIFGYKSFTHTGTTGDYNTGFGSLVFNNLYSTTNVNNTSIGYNNTLSGSSINVTNQTSVGSNSVSNGVPYYHATVFGDNIFTAGASTTYKSDFGVFFGSNILKTGYSITSTIIGNLTYSGESTQQATGKNTILGNKTFSKNNSHYNDTFSNTILGNNLNVGLYYTNQTVLIGNNSGNNINDDNRNLTLIGNNVMNVLFNAPNKTSRGNNITWIGDGTKSIIFLTQNGQNNSGTLLGTSFRAITGNTFQVGGNQIFGNSLGLLSVGLTTNIGYNNLSDSTYTNNSTFIGSNIFSKLPINSTTYAMGYEICIGRDIVKDSTSGASFPGQGSGQSIIIGDGACISGATMLQSVHIGRYTSAYLNEGGVENEGRTANATYGEYSLFRGNNSIRTVSLGSYSLYNLTGSNSNNIAIGYYSGYNLKNSSNNTFIGSLAGYSLTGGSNNTFIGYNTNYSATSVSNIVYIGNSSVGTIYSQPTSITLLSDIRDKKNIDDLKLGINFINELKPSKFEWSLREGKRDKTKSSGFIAQEIEEVEKKFESLDYTNISQKISDEYLTVSYNNLIPIMVKSLQDLSKKNKELKERIKKITI